MKKYFNVLKQSFYLLLFALVFTACEKDDPIPSSVNLGDLGQDMIAYGSKLYVSVNGSSRITIFDLNKPAESGPGVFILNQGTWGENNAYLSYYNFQTGKLQFDITTTRQPLKSIDLLNGKEPREPRYLASYNGKVYVTTYDGNVIRIDTTSLTQDGITPVGSNPEGIAATNGKLYIANSGGTNYPNFDNTLSIVDIATFKEEKVLTVGLNPFIVRTDNYGNVYLTYKGNYGDSPGGFQKIDTKTNVITDIAIPANQEFTIAGDLLYFYGVTYNPDYSTNNTIGIYNVKTEQSVTNQFITDNTKFSTPYGIGVNPKNSDVYIADTDYSNPGIVYVFGSDGKKKNTINAGINPCKFVFY
jgi:hypothetical protein